MQSDAVDGLAYYFLIFFSMGVMFSHALKKDKQLINYLVAIFSASLCMIGVQKLSADSIGAFQYVIGLATCATCNVVWLIARTLFRESSPISRRHICLALVIAGLIIFNQTWHLMVAVDIQNILNDAQMLRLKQGMNEITNLLSSSILALSFWEAFRAYTSKNTLQKRQSIVFASAFFMGVFNSAVMPKFLFSPAEIQYYNPWIMTSSALLILAAIQYVIYSQEKARVQKSGTQSKLIGLGDDDTVKSQKQPVDPKIISGIQDLLTKDKIYLQANLKIANVAQALNTSEYLISNAVRNHFDVANFNLFINRYRVKHAQTLLRDANSQHWSILVISLESGFSSVGTFNRVFKAITGKLPNEFRKQSGFDEMIANS